MEKPELLRRLKNFYQTKTIVTKDGPNSADAQQWLASVAAHLRLVDGRLYGEFDTYRSFIVLHLSGPTLEGYWSRMQAILASAIAHIEVQIPDEREPKIYGAGEAFDLYKDLAQIMSVAKKDVFIIDPWASDEIFTLYLDKVPSGTKIRLLTGIPSDTLKAVKKKFTLQPGVQLEARSSSEIHDRVIFIDDTDCWVLGQSIKDAATKKPTYLVPVNAVTDMAKLYADAWGRAIPY